MKTKTSLSRPAAHLFLIFVALYFSGLARYPLSIDAEMSHFLDPSEWVSQGRWGTYLVAEFVLPRPVVPFLPLALFGLGAVGSYLFFLRASQIHSLKAGHYLAFALYAGFPIWFFILEFPANTASVSLGLASASCAVWVLFATLDNRAPTDPLQIALVAVAVSFYQSFLMFYAASVLAVTVIRLATHDAVIWRPLWRGCLTAALGLAAYFIVHLSLTSWLQMSTAYIGGIFDIALLMADPITVGYRMVNQIGELYLGDQSIYGSTIWALPPLIFLAFVALFMSMPWRKAAISALLLLALTLVPFAQIPFTGGSLPYRTFFAVPLVVATLALVAMSSTAGMVRILALACSLLVVFHSVATFNQWIAIRENTETHDRLLAAAIYEKIVAVNPGFDRSQTYVIDTYGAKNYTPQYPAAFTSTTAGSFFGWDGGVPWRIVAFMRVIGFDNLSSVSSSEQRLLNRSLFEDMPVWPNDGSVRAVEGVTLIKLGNEPGYYAGG